MLKAYLNNFLNTPIDADAFESYKTKQRQRVEEMNRTFSTYDYKLRPGVLVSVRMKHVISLKEFFVIQSNHIDALNRFDKELFQIYGKDAEPLEMPYPNDVCVINEKDMWFRATIGDIMNRANMCSVFLVDHGSEIIVERKKIYVLKEIHSLVTPFIYECKLCDLIENVHVKATHSETILNKIKSIDQFLLYPNENDVMMLVDSPSAELPYFLHEGLGAFVYQKLMLGDPYDCWIRKMFAGEIQTKSLYTEKHRVKIVIESPKEIFLKNESSRVGKCYLDISGDWLESSSKELQTLADTYKEFAVSFGPEDDADTCPITLWATNSKPDLSKIEIWDNLGLKLISVAIKQKIYRFIKKAEYRKNRGESIDSDELQQMEFLRNLLFEDESEVQEGITEWQPPMAIGNIVRGVVTHVTKQGTIYFMDEQNCEVALNISNQIRNIIKDHPNQDFLPSPGETCFAKYIDGEFYRGVVEKYNGNGDSCQIRFIDYGNEMDTKITDIYRATDFGGIPCLVNRLQISSIHVVNDKMSNAVYGKFSTQLIERVSTVHIDNVNLDNLSIIPCSIRPEHLQCDFTDWLAQNGLGYGLGLNEDNDKILYV